MTELDRCFSDTYAQARQRFVDACAQARAVCTSHTLPGHRGPDGEDLAMDVARLGPADAARVLIVTSGTHGVEGYCGSGVQLALLHDAPLRHLATSQGTALVLVHAVNPYGFAHLHRTNEDNIDLNRNAVDFDAALPPNDGYGELHDALVPSSWPPPTEAEMAIGRFLQQRGFDAFRTAVTSGQYSHPTGLFYGGAAPSWSVQRLADVLDAHAATAAQVGWIDLHTGLGPCGHGEKIHVGTGDATALARARAWWGADVTDTIDGSSVSVDVSGPVCTLAAARCRGQVTAMALEYGTLPVLEVLGALRADAWRRSHAEAPAAQRQAVARQLRDAFYVDRDDWKGMVLGQGRTCVLQALQGLAAPT